MFSLPQLPYDFAGLEPVIDAMTMEIHFTKHHQAYVDNLNKALEGNADLMNTGLDALVAGVNGLPDAVKTAVRNNGGGHWNHSFFWTLMKPQSSGGPGSRLAEAITQAFGSVVDFQAKFAEAAMKRFGSGWVWLGVDANKKLVVCSTPNQDNPLMKGLVDCECTPILGLDVWEHAYYLKYQNKRADYVTAWWGVVNWGEVERRFTALMA